MPPLLEARALSKRYHELRALADVSITFEAGEVHAVIGENGAGKSTLMGILAGFVRPDSGEVSLAGERVPAGSPLEMKRRGVEMVHQHFTLVQEFTVAENLALAAGGSGLSRLDIAELSKGALKVAAELGWHVPPHAKVGELPVGVQQRVEILKALSRDAKVVILDEPTAVLSEGEVQELLGVLRGLADRGKSVILIAHKLGEVLEVSDRISVLRHGRLVASMNASEATHQGLARLMLGRDETPAGAKQPVSASHALTVRSLSVRGSAGNLAVRDVDFEIGKGEILGFGGVDGNGQVELAECLAGIRPPAGGELLWQGRQYVPERTGYVPGDRQQEALAMKLSVQDNLLLLPRWGSSLSWGPFLRPRAACESAQNVVECFGIKLRSLADPAESLSGGNQQKVAVGRVLAEAPDVVVVVNPTRGLDVGAAEFVRRSLRDASAAGAAIALFSSDNDELDAVADRLVYMGGGRLFDSPAEAVGAHA